MSLVDIPGMRHETLSLQRRVRGPRYCRYYITNVRSQTQSHITDRRSLLILLRSIARQNKSSTVRDQMKSPKAAISGPPDS